MSSVTAASFLAPTAPRLHRLRGGRVASRPSRRYGAVTTTAGAPMVTVDEGKVMLDRDGYKMLDIRPFKAYDREHLTKPPQCTANVALAPGTLPDAKFVAAVESQGFPKGAKLLVTDFDGEICQQAADMLHDAGFTAVVAVQGGYNGWRKVFTTCGRRRPPQGKWVSTGKEALKSGLTLDPNVAAAYEENWGKEPPKHGEVGKAGDEAKEEEKEDSASASVADNIVEEVVADEDGFKVKKTFRINDDGTRTEVDMFEAAAASSQKSSKVTTLGTRMEKPPITGVSGGGAAEGSNWETFYTDDAERKPYYVNKKTGVTQWDEPKRWWSGGRWIEAE